MKNNDNIKYELSILPRDINNPRNIRWEEAIGIKIPFEYDSLKGIFTIIDFYKKDTNHKYVTLEYNNNSYIYSTQAFLTHNIKNMFGKFTQRYKIGQVVKAKNSNLKILGVSIATRMNKKDSRRYIRYEVLCLTCGYVFRKD